MAVDDTQPLITHLIELRKRLLNCIIAVFVIFLCLVYFANDIYQVVSAPLIKQMPLGATMIATDVASPFFTPIKLTFWVSLIASAPVILYQVWAFVAPALYKHERKLVIPLLISSSLLFYIGMAHTSGVKGSVLMAVHVFFAILISAKLFHYERLNAPKLLGCLCGFGGVLLINLSGGGLGGGFTLLGDGAVLLAALANGFSISLFKRYAEGEDTLTLCGYQFIVGGGLLLLTGLCFGGTLPHFTGQSLLLLGYMVLLSAVAQTIWSALTRYNPVGRVAVYGFLNPVFGVLLSALLLREGQQAFTPYSLAALVLVCVGIFVVNRSDAPGRGAQADQQP